MRDYYYVIEILKLFHQGNQCLVKISKHNTRFDAELNKGVFSVLSGDEIFQAKYAILTRTTEKGE